MRDPLPEQQETGMSSKQKGCSRCWKTKPDMLRRAGGHGTRTVEQTCIGYCSPQLLEQRIPQVDTKKSPSNKGWVARKEQPLKIGTSLCRGGWEAHAVSRSVEPDPFKNQRTCPAHQVTLAGARSLLTCHGGALGLRRLGGKSEMKTRILS